MSRRSGRTAAWSTVATALALVACTGSPPAQSPSAAAPSPTAATTARIKLMEFNIEYGGTQVDFRSVPRAIDAAGADVVAIEEGYAQMPRIARALGWDYYDNRTQIVSKYPLLAPSDDSPLTFVEVAPGRVIAIGNVHLPSESYGPFHVRAGMSVDDVVAIENRLRVPAVKPSVDALASLASAGMPVFLLGDFNTPSHLDWTPDAIEGQRDKKHPVDWPVGEVVEAAGLRDSYRELHPDPVSDPGLTWPANRPFVSGYNPYRHGDTRDRIDFIYDGGPATPTATQIVGEAGVPGVDIRITPWPSDHRAIVTAFDVSAAVPPTIVAVDRRLIESTDAATVRFHAPDGDGRVVAVPAGDDPATSSVADAQTEGTDGFADLKPNGRWTPGGYEAVLLDASGEAIASIDFWVESPLDGPLVETDRRTYGVGDPIEVTWSRSPGNRFDWIGVYPRHADPNVASYAQWLYTGATVVGSATIDTSTEGPWPIRPGTYSVYLLADDSYARLGGADFSVR